MRPRTRLAIVVGLAAAGALILPGSALRAAWANLRRYSAPSARPYDLLAGPLFGDLYRRIADEVSRACPSGTVLEIGPGPGHLAAAIAGRSTAVDVVGVDIDPTMVALATARAEREGVASRVRFVVGDVAALPLADASADLAVSTLSLHHWPERVRGFDEIHRVLRPGGRALIVDVHPAWARFETAGPSAAEALAASAFRGGVLGPYGWPFGLPLLVRLDLLRQPDEP